MEPNDEKRDLHGASMNYKIRKLEYDMQTSD